MGRAVRRLAFAGLMVMLGGYAFTRFTADNGWPEYERRRVEVQRLEQENRELEEGVAEERRRVELLTKDRSYLESEVTSRTKSAPKHTREFIHGPEPKK